MTQNTMENNAAKPMREQITYANLLFLGAWCGILLLFITYFIYATGILPPHASMEAVVANWGQSAHHFHQVTGSPMGWEWIGLLHSGDYLNFIGLALLALLTIVCYLTLLPGYFRRRDWTYFTICILEVLVLGVAASGVLGSGGH
ncbi:MAG: hypothetical protein PWQ57_1460 [Desulfovibrionales bacterium]|nr:hypothetical protein [Desulfovibrionales bacterium]